MLLCYGIMILLVSRHCFVFYDLLLHSFVLLFALIGHCLVHCYRQWLTINHVSQCMAVHEYIYIYNTQLASEKFENFELDESLLTSFIALLT